MATTSVTMTATCLNGKPLEALERLIAQRQREMGETTSQAVIATAINILSSIRAATKVADPKKDSGFVTVAAYPSLVQSWRTEGKHHRLCLRPAGGGAHVDVSFINAAGPVNARGYHPLVFLAQDRGASSIYGMSRRYFILANNLEAAKKFAFERHSRRVQRYAGLAKAVIGKIQSDVWQQAVSGPSISSIAAKTVQVAARSIVQEHGYSSGNVYVEIDDRLKYAMLALKNGQADFEQALMRAANRTAGILNHSWQQKLFSYAPIPTPFPEVAGRKH